MKFIIVLLLFTISCTTPDSPSEIKDIIPQITIEYLDSVYGYKIKILWIPNKIASDENESIVGPAIIELIANDGKKYYANYTNYSGYYSDENFIMKGDFVQSFKPIFMKKKYSKGGEQFEFKDVNFDNKKELIINETGFLDYSRPYYRIFEFLINTDHHNNTLQELMDPVYSNYANSTYDTINKEVIIREYNGCCEVDLFYYKFKYNKPENGFYMYKSEIL